MNKKEALEIITMIVDGLNPYNNILNIDDIPENNPATIRALCTAIVSLLNKCDRDKLASGYRQKNYSELSRSANGPLRVYFEKKDKEEILKALIEANYNEKKAAETLKIPIFELDKRIKICNFKKLCFLLTSKILKYTSIMHHKLCRFKCRKSIFHHNKSNHLYCRQNY